MPNIYYPILSSILSVDSIPEELSFITSSLDVILDNIHYRELTTYKSFEGASVSCNLEIISYSNLLRFEIPGTGLVLILNPDLDNPNVNFSVIPISLTWSLSIQQYLRNFKISNFSFQNIAFYDIIFTIASLSDKELLLSVVDNLIEGDDPLNTFVLTCNTKYPDLDIPYPINPDLDTAINDTLNAIDQNTGITLREIIFDDYILDVDDISDSLEKLNQLFFSQLGYDAIGSIKDLFIPKISASLQIAAGLEIPRSILVPLKADGSVEKDENIKTVLLFEAGEFIFNSIGGFGFNDILSLSFPASHPKAQIGSTGIVIGFTGAKLDLNKNSNIPEADIAGYPVDFMGLYVQHATIGFNSFGQDDTEKVSAKVTADNFLIGTGGVSGTIALESDGLLYRKFGNFAIELDTFSITFRQNSIVNSEIKGKLTIGRFKQGLDPAIIDIEAHIQDNGDFSITALPQTALKVITLPNVLDLEITSFGLGKEERGFYIEVAGKINFIADLPVLGDVLPKGIEVKKLRIWDNGDLEFKGGGLQVPKAFRLNVGPVKMEVTNISIGSYSRKLDDIERSYRYFGFDGMINTGMAGINATGNGIKFYYTADDDGAEKPFDCFISIDRIAIDLTIPGNASKDNAAFILNGHLSMNNPDPQISGSSAGSEYSGSVAFSMPRLKLAGSAAMRLNPAIPSFVVDIGLDLSTPIPLGATGLGIYGFRGLIGQHYLPSKSATTPPLPDSASWWDYYKAKSTNTGREGVEIDKFADKPGYSVGAGMSIATAFDSGKVFSSKLFLLLGLPDVFLIQGQAGILRSRIGLDDKVDPPFSAFIAIDSSSFRGNLGVDYRLPEGGTFDGNIFSLNGTLDMAFFFNNSSGWYLNVGKDQPESARVRAKILTLFQGYAYLMISSRGFRAGAGAKFDFNKSFGPVGVGIGASLDLGGSIGFSPVQIGAFIQFGGYAYLRVLFIKLGLAVQISLAVEAPHPFNIAGGLQIKIKLPWPIKDITFRLDVSWYINNNNAPLLQPIRVLQLPDPIKGYIPAAATNILSSEIFPLNYINHEITGSSVIIPAPGDSSWLYNFNDAEEVMQVTIPLDSFIDIELLKPVKPDLLKLGGADNQLPAGYTELVPPQKGLSNQVKHEFQLTGLEIYAWNDTGAGSWQSYNIYEAVTAIVLENNGPGAIDLGSLKEGYWQFTEPGKYNKIRLLSQNMFSYANQSTNVTSDLDGLNFRRKDLFCFETIIKETVVNWIAEPLNTVYPQYTSVFIKGVTFVFENLTGSVRNNPDSGNQSLFIEANGGKINIQLPKAVTSFNMDFGVNQNDIRIDFVKTDYIPGDFGQSIATDNYMAPSFLLKSQQNSEITYNHLDAPIDKIILTFTGSNALDFEGNLILGGHFPLPDQYITANNLSRPHLEDMGKALMFVTFFNRSFTVEEVLTEGYRAIPGTIAQWPMDSIQGSVGNNPGIISGSPDFIPGFYEKNDGGIEVLHNVYSFTDNTDAFFIPFAPELKVESGSFAFEVTAIFNPFISGISTLLYKVNEDPITGFKKGFALHLYQDTPGDTGADYTDVATVPTFRVWLTCYQDLTSSGVYATEKYSVDCGTAKLSARQYKHILVSVNRETGELAIFIDRVLKVTVPIPAELSLLGLLPATTYLNQLSYLSESQQRSQEENGITKDGLIDEIQILSDNLNKTVQPVWRPDTTYAVTIKTRDVVNGNVAGAAEVSHIFGFKTAGPVGHFQQQSSIYQALAEQDRTAEFKLANLKDYIDYQRSSPDAQSRYDLSKPVFYLDPKISLLFVKPYMNAMFANWDNYHGLPAVNSSLQIQLFDPFGVPVSPELIWEQLPDVAIDINNYQSLPPDQQILFLMNFSASADACNENPLTIKKRTKQGSYHLPDLEPNRLYTALFNAIYQPEGEAEQKAEVHKYSFKTSRFASFQEQAGSFILNTVPGEEQYAFYPVPVAFTDTEIEETIKVLIDDNTDNDPDAVLRYAVKYDRLVYGGLALKNLEPVETTVINLVVNVNPADGNDKRILGILIRNPEAFNDPKLPAELLADTIQLSLTLADDTVSGPDQFIYIHSRDTSAVFITNTAVAVPQGNMQLSFRYKLFNGNDYETEHEDYTGPVIQITTNL